MPEISCPVAECVKRVKTEEELGEEILVREVGVTREEVEQALKDGDEFASQIQWASLCCG